LVDLLGSCKNGDNCSFAHGDNDLRATNNRHTPHYPPQQTTTINSQDTYQQPAYPMMYNDNQIILFQLNFIVQRLYSLYQDNEQVMPQLRYAADLLNAGNIDVSADILHVS
jgi:hypothetical protein